MLADSLLKVIKKAPTEGLDMLSHLVAAGAFSLDTPLPVAGQSKAQPFVIELHAQALADLRSISNVQHGGLLQAMYTPAGLTRWKETGLLSSVFAQQSSGGKWVPHAVLDMLADVSDRANARPPVVVKLSKDIDNWLAALTPVFPQTMLDQVGGELLCRAMELELNAATHALWPRVGATALDAQGRPAVLRATRVEHWTRYLKEGGSLDIEVGQEGTRLWECLLARSLTPTTPSRAHFQHAFEDWFIRQDRPEFEEGVRALAVAKIQHAKSMSPDQWIQMFSRSGTDWVQWRTSEKSQRPAWLAIALAHPEQAMFSAFDQAPALLAMLPSELYAQARQSMALGEVSAAKLPERAQEALERLAALVDRQGWRATAQPLIEKIQPFMFTEKDTLSRVATLGARDPLAWWGNEVASAQLAKVRAQELVAKDPLPPRAPLEAWVALHEGWDSPWIRVASSFARAVRAGAMEELVAQDPTDALTLLADTEGQKWLISLRKHFSGDRRKQVDAWMDNLRLELDTPQVGSGSARAPRL